MPIDYRKLLELDIPEVEQTYSEKDVILYALGVGLGESPDDPETLRFVYEKDLRVLPTLAVVLAQPGLWPRDLDTGIDYLHVLHGEQRLRIHHPLPVRGTVIGRTRVTNVVDKGPKRGALLLSEREIFDKDSGALLATVGHTAFCRNDGGFGGPSGPLPPRVAMPDQAPDIVCMLSTVPQMALIYRLSADLNPLHVDPETAVAAGFRRPVLHGLATYGVAAHAILRAVCDYDPARIRALDCRFTAPAYAGETFATEIWLDGSSLVFRTRAVERDVVVISHGRAELAA